MENPKVRMCNILGVFFGEFTVTGVYGKKLPYVYFNELIYTYIPGMYIWVFKNAWNIKTTYVCTFQIPASGVACKGYVYNRYVKLGNGG